MIRLISESSTDAVAAADTAVEDDFDVEMPPAGNQNPDCAPGSKSFFPLIGNILQFLDQNFVFTLMFVCRYWRDALRIVPMNVVAGESFSFDPEVKAPHTGDIWRSLQQSSTPETLRESFLR